MELLKLTIHQLIKEKGSLQVEDFLTESIMTVNQDTQELVEKLNKSFIRDSITYALFKSDEGDNFPNYFNRYTSSNKDDRDFVNFSRLALLNLKQIIQNVRFAKGGYFVFAEYIENQTTFLSIFLIRDEEGVLFNKDSATRKFNINRVSYLNTNKLAMGCRINIEKYSGQDGKYIAMIKNNLAEISDYFNNWISITQPESSTEYTNTLYEIVSNATTPLNPETNTIYTIDEFRKKVYDYVKNRPNKIVCISEMSYYFYQDENYLSEYVNENNITIDSEFKVDGRSLKKFWRLDINADGIQLRFSRGDLNTKVRLSEEDENSLIIESPHLVRKFRAEINGL